MRIRVQLLMLFCATAILATEARGDDLNVQLLYHQSYNLYDSSIGEEPTSLWGLFQVAFAQRATNVFEDRFQPYNFSNVKGLWVGQDFDNIRDYDATVARHAFADSISSSAGDAVLALNLPIINWIRRQQGFFANFLWNSLDDADEESVSARDPSYHSAAYSWWQTQLQEGHLRYGVRPFRRDPYAYVGGRFKDAGSVWFLWDARYYLRNSGDHCFELTLAAPITGNLSLQLGTSYQFGRHPTQKSAVLQLLKTFKSGGTLSVGAEMRERPTLVAAITLPWG